MGAADDARHMARAIAWARRGLGGTYPNPCVGAVLIRRGQVVGAARSAATGGPHGEVRAIAAAGDAARGSTLYVTLEPCCHRGRTGPCTEAIIGAGIRRVVVGVIDPAPHAAGKGLRRLRAAGVDVELGVAAERAADVHAHYLHQVRGGQPWVTLKAAIGLDGRIAVRTGHSRWITGEAARRDAHRLRATHHAVAVGIGTVLADDPQLDVRLVRGCNPIVLVFDTHLRIATALPRRVLRPGTWVLHGPHPRRDRVRAVLAAGALTVAVPCGDDGRIDVNAALRALGQRTVRSILVEGGGALIGAFVAADAWQHAVLLQAPKLLGAGGPSWIEGAGWDCIEDTPAIEVVGRAMRGDDLRLDIRPRRRAAAVKRGRLTPRARAPRRTVR